MRREGHDRPSLRTAAPRLPFPSPSPETVPVIANHSTVMFTFENTFAGRRSPRPIQAAPFSRDMAEFSMVVSEKNSYLRRHI